MRGARRRLLGDRLGADGRRRELRLGRERRAGRRRHGVRLGSREPSGRDRWLVPLGATGGGLRELRVHGQRGDPLHDLGAGDGEGTSLDRRLHRGDVRRLRAHGRHGREAPFLAARAGSAHPHHPGARHETASRDRNARRDRRDPMGRSNTRRSQARSRRVGRGDQPVRERRQLRDQRRRRGVHEAAVPGDGVSLRTLRGPAMGRAQIWVDGALVRVVDLYSPAEAFATTRLAAGLVDGWHTARIVVVGTHRAASSGNRVAIDRWLVV